MRIADSKPSMRSVNSISIQTSVFSPPGRRKGFDVKLGDGDINWKAVMTALDAIGYNTWMCAEVSGGGVDVLKDISQRMDRILAL
jgi:sugar phosphate isomerase/epimerase